MLRCLLVDDEQLALRLLTEFVGRLPFLTLVGTARTALDALAILQAEPVDLLFLDIQMPKLTGTDFVRSLRPEALVIFTTAYQQYAAESYDLAAVDYLVKPFAFERFMRAAHRAQEQHAARQNRAAPAAPADEDYLFVKADYHTLRLNIRDILYLEGLKDYLKIHLRTGKPVVTLGSLRAYEERLAARGFVRVHRSYLVALRHIDSIRTNRIYLGAAIIPVGDTYAAAFAQAISDRLGS
ncbi:LytR/AlgR family response regulator transcription factor [Hymenobacter terricola]|uniref:LytR/AlgR family response regulator transcription factor n=1 Tax=Hymenobacter terricola TaxID=2819236 RepID=UPI001CF403F4|nr:LytTR family DNA-binding domain-containing protein [Hymenobacter terricola]